jgi:hypothetical protein
MAIAISIKIKQSDQPIFKTDNQQFKSIKTNMLKKKVNLNFSKLSNNNSLTAKQQKYTDLCNVINWLFITLVLVSYKNACIYMIQAFFI